MVKFDKDTREAIKEAISEGIQKALSNANEQWLTSEQVLQQFGMLSKEWMRHNAWRLPSGLIEYTDETGKVVRTRRGYARSAIINMIKTSNI